MSPEYDISGALSMHAKCNSAVGTGQTVTSRKSLRWTGRCTCAGSLKSIESKSGHMLYQYEQRCKFFSSGQDISFIQRIPVQTCLRA